MNAPHKPRSAVTTTSAQTAATLRGLTLSIYQAAADHALKQGIIIADTKFEFGVYEGKIILCDEVLTPDSSRFWPVDDYAPGRAQKSLDKQYVRDYLLSADWDRNSPPPPLPPEVIDQTSRRYLDIFRILTDRREL